jgi:hypothetical protein
VADPILILVTPLPIVSEDKPVQLPNAYAAIERMVFGIVYDADDCFMYWYIMVPAVFNNELPSVE